MPLEFRQLSSEPDDADLIRQAMMLTNGQIHQDGRVPLEDLEGMVDPSDPGMRVYGLVDGELLVSVATVEYGQGIAGRPSEPGEYELGLLAVQPEHQKYGVGRYMLRQVEEHTTALGGTALYVGYTRKSRDFYLKVGYHLAGGQQEYAVRNLTNPKNAQSQNISPPPKLRTAEQILAGGNFVETVTLGSALVKRAMGEVLMVQVLVNEARRAMAEVMQGSTRLDGVQALIVAVEKRLQNTGDRLRAGADKFDGYCAGLRQGKYGADSAP